jgi:hypothetical protein
MMKANKHRMVLAVLCVGMASGLSLPGAAHATLYSDYSCSSKPAWQWCEGRANNSFDGLHSWDYNEGKDAGTYDGIEVCQHLWRPSTGAELGEKTCGLNITWKLYGVVTCPCYEAEVLQKGPGSYSIAGEAWAN